MYVHVEAIDFDRVNRGMLDRHFRPNPERVALREAYDRATRYSDYRRMFDAQKDMWMAFAGAIIALGILHWRDRRRMA